MFILMKEFDFENDDAKVLMLDGKIPLVIATFKDKLRAMETLR